MTALGLGANAKDLDRLSADDETVSKAVELLAKMDNRANRYGYNLQEKQSASIQKRSIYAVLPWLIVALVIAGLVTLINSFLSVVWLQIAVYFLWSLVVIMIGLDRIASIETLDRLDQSDVTSSNEAQKGVSHAIY